MSLPPPEHECAGIMVTESDLVTLYDLTQAFDRAYADVVYATLKFEFGAALSAKREWHEALKERADFVRSLVATEEAVTECTAEVLDDAAHIHLRDGRGTPKPAAMGVG